MRHASNQVSCRLLMSQRGTGLEADHGCVESLVLDQPSSLQSSVIVVVSWLEILNWPNWQFFFCVWFQWNLWTAFAQCCQTGLAHHSVLTKTTQTPFQHSQQMLLHVTQGFGQDFFPTLKFISLYHIVPSLQLNLRPMAYSMRLFSALWLGGRSAAL